MAVIEIQFRQQKFFDIIAAQVLRVDPPAAIVERLPAGSLIERIEVTEVAFAEPTEMLWSDTELGFRVRINVHVTTLAAAKAAGSLQKPATTAVPCAVWLRLGGAAPSSLRWAIARLEVVGQFVPILAPPQMIDLGGLGTPVTDIFLFAGADVVSIRFWTPSGGAIDTAPVDRIGAADWGQFIPGDVFAETLADELYGATQGAAAGSTDPVIEVGAKPTGHWDGGQQAAFASVGITAVDALPADIDVPVSIYARAEPRPDPVLDRISIRTRVSWAAHDFITDLSGGAIEVVEDEVSDAILDRLKPPAGMVELEQGDRHVVFEAFRPMIEPVTPLFRATVDSVFTTAAGVGATGTVNVYPPPVAHFTLEDQHYESGIDCHARQYRTEFRPPIVSIFCPDRFYSLRFLAGPTVEPPGFWTPGVQWSGYGPGNQIAHVRYDLPPGGLKPVGQTSSGTIVTNLGVRWVDLGAIPAHPPALENPLAMQAKVISQCMAISDRWGMGVFNLDWLVDPPDLNLGRDPLREWTITADAVQSRERVELVAVGPSGERSLGMLSVDGGRIFAQVVTDAEETLSVRGVVAAVDPPQVKQRWIVPFAETEAGGADQLFTDGDGLVLFGDAAPRRVDVDALRPLTEDAATFRTPGSGGTVSARLAKRLGRNAAENKAVPRTAGRGRTVAVLHRGSIVMGVAGPLVGVGQREAPRARS